MTFSIQRWSYWEVQDFMKDISLLVVTLSVVATMMRKMLLLSAGWTTLHC